MILTILLKIRCLNDNSDNNNYHYYDNDKTTTTMTTTTMMISILLYFISVLLLLSIDLREQRICHEFLKVLYPGNVQSRGRERIHVSLLP